MKEKATGKIRMRKGGRESKREGKEEWEGWQEG